MTKDLLACSFIDSTGGLDITFYILYLSTGISRDRTCGTNLGRIQLLSRSTIIIGF